MFEPGSVRDELGPTYVEGYRMIKWSESMDFSDPNWEKTAARASTACAQFVIDHGSTIAQALIPPTESHTTRRLARQISL
ncbi:MAG: hypothetical protein ACI9D0_000489 [Bacteroidia bacterium]